MDNIRIFRRTDDILEFLVGENAVAGIRDDTENDNGEGEEVCESVWDKEAVGAVSIAIY